jgi:hypothetical protein
MMITEFFLGVLYAQITVLAPGAPVGGLLWTDDHVEQGFAWSDGYVSFGLPDHDGQVLVRVLRPASYEPAPNTIWAVQTPFRTGTSPLMIGTIAIERPVAVPPGSYNLVFEARRPEEDAGDLAYVVQLHFIPSASPEFRIIRTGGDVTTDTVLRTDADPA